MDEDERNGLQKTFTKALVAICVRNGYLEEQHAGKQPSSKTGDFSDVKVVTPYGEIPWNEVSRISDEEMQILMKDIVNNVYTVISQEHDDEYMIEFMTFAQNYFRRWDEPEINPKLLKKHSSDGK